MAHHVFSSNGTIGIAAPGYYIPEGIMTAGEMAQRSGILLFVFKEKIGVQV